MKNRFWALTFFVLVAGGLCVAQSDAPSLADVAKQQKSDKKASLVLNDDDMPSRVPPDTTAPTDSAKPADHTDGAQKSDGKDSSSKASKDSSSTADLKKQLASLKVEQDGWKAAAKNYESRLANESDDFRRQADQEALDNDNKNIAYYQSKINQAQAALSGAQKSGSSTQSTTSQPSGSGASGSSQQ